MSPYRLRADISAGGATVADPATSGIMSSHTRCRQCLLEPQAWTLASSELLDAGDSRMPTIEALLAVFEMFAATE